MCRNPPVPAVALFAMALMGQEPVVHHPLDHPEIVLGLTSCGMRFDEFLVCILRSGWSTGGRISVREPSRTICAGDPDLSLHPLLGEDRWRVAMKIPTTGCVLLVPRFNSSIHSHCG